jgi:hypothetical protein
MTGLRSLEGGHIPSRLLLEAMRRPVVAVVDLLDAPAVGGVGVEDLVA